MKICAQTVKTLRKQRLWSQEELALACGLSLRTIQRAEGDGQASAETIKALAAVFEVATKKLIEPAAPSPNYINTQLGITIIVIVFAGVVGALWALSQAYVDSVEFIFPIVICALILCLFSSLTTRVENGYVKWNFGIGVISKAVPISRVVSTEVVRNKAWWGFGIRLIPKGWMYNVSGLNAVELVLDDGKRIRIGSDDAEEFDRAIKLARAIAE